MSVNTLTSRQITTATVLAGGPKENYLQVNSNEFNKLQADVAALNSNPYYGLDNSTAVNATATLTAAQIAKGYITSTSAAAVTMTLPTGTLLGNYIGATQGTILDLFIDNTAGSNTVTIAVATNGIKSDAANTTAGSFGQLTVAFGATGVGCFRIMFSSATTYVFTRIA